MSGPRHKNDLAGKHFGRWTVIKLADIRQEGGTGHPRAYWLCRCSCGVEKAVKRRSLLEGTSTSCGCYSKEMRPYCRRTHGQYKEKLHGVWAAMKQRCYWTRGKAYKNYGGRGITVCDAWHTYEGFRAWALVSGYKEGLTIERVDVNGNYCPENCVWATTKTQGDNKRNTVRITIDGITKTRIGWAKQVGLTADIIRGRIRLGWSAEKAIFTPAMSRGERRKR